MRDKVRTQNEIEAGAEIGVLEHQDGTIHLTVMDQIFEFGEMLTKFTKNI